MTTTRWFLTFAATLALAAPALANDGPTPREFGLMVDGPDVLIRLSLAEGGEPASVDVIREGPDGEEHVGELAWSATGSYAEWVTCHEDGTDCELEPEYCNDCDGDGVAECDGWCDRWGAFELVDGCVPVAEDETASYTYRVENTQYAYQAEATVQVAHEDACQIREEYDGPIMTDGCTIGGEADPSQLPTRLALAMAAIGAVALTLGRSRKRA